MLTDRQIELLEAIINEYMTSSEPVGSTTLVDKYNLQYSAATVRNEMADLLKEGFLEMLHTSSGRIPTSRAFKFFLNELLEEEELPVLQEVAIKQRVWPARFDMAKLLRQVSLSLAEMVNQVVFATYDDEVVYGGVENLLSYKEFWEIDTAKAALHLLDRHESLDPIFRKVPRERGNVYCVIGEELGDDNLEFCSVLFSPYKAERTSGYIGLLGPARMNYPKTIPAVRYAANLIEELTSSI